MNQSSIDQQQTLDIVRDQHKALLAQMGRTGDVDTEKVQLFLNTMSQAGASIDGAENRSILNELLRYWSNFIYEKTGGYPVVELQPFDEFKKINKETGKPKFFFQKSTQPSIPITVHPAYPSLLETQRVDDILSSSTSQQNRLRMLKRVHSIWITGVLEHSLQNAKFIELNMHEKPDAVNDPWRLLLQGSYQTERSLPPGTSITQLYDAANGELLILGEPGSGKTTLLLELMSDLLKRAEYNNKHPIPILFILVSWAKKQQSLVDWIVEEMNTKYQVPRMLSKLLVDTDQVLPLLDGLDEVDQQYRSACARAINNYRLQHGLASIVVSSRSSEYMALSDRLLLSSAVVVQPLTLQQVNDHLSNAGEEFYALQLKIGGDPALQGLATTPLMLNVLKLVYRGAKAEELLTVDTDEGFHRQIFAAYIERMLQHRGPEAPYTTQQIVHWLGWLARQLIQRDQSIFYLERIQPDWLPDGQVRRVYQYLAIKLPTMLISGLLSFLVFGIIHGPAASFIYGLIGILLGVFASRSRTADSPPEQNSIRWRSIWSNPTTVMYIKNGLIYGVVYALIGGFESRYGFNLAFLGLLIGVLFSMLYGKVTAEIRPVEMLNWSWRGALNAINIRSIISSLFVGLSAGLSVGLIGGLRVGLGYGLSIGLAYWLFLGPYYGLSRGILEARNHIVPNQGIKRSLRDGLLFGLISVFIGSLSYWFIVGLSYKLITLLGPGLGIEPGLSVGLNNWLSSSLIIGLTVGLLSGLLNGGLTYFQHMILRLLLWSTTSTPWNYVKFLDYATEWILLHRVGGGYTFVHRLLLKYFASLETASSTQTDDIKRL